MRNKYDVQRTRRAIISFTHHMLTNSAIWVNALIDPVFFRTSVNEARRLYKKLCSHPPLKSASTFIWTHLLQVDHEESLHVLCFPLHWPLKDALWEQNLSKCSPAIAANLFLFFFCLGTVDTCIHQVQLTTQRSDPPKQKINRFVKH